MSEKMEKMTLRDYYAALSHKPSPKTEFMRKLQEMTGRHYQTILNWCRGVNVPTDKADIEAIEKLTGIPKEELFD